MVACGFDDNLLPCTSPFSFEGPHSISNDVQVRDYLLRQFPQNLQAHEIVSTCIILPPFSAPEALFLTRSTQGADPTFHLYVAAHDGKTDGAYFNGRDHTEHRLVFSKAGIPQRLGMSIMRLWQSMLLRTKHHARSHRRVLDATRYVFVSRLDAKRTLSGETVSPQMGFAKDLVDIVVLLAEYCVEKQAGRVEEAKTLSGKIESTLTDLDSDASVVNASIIGCGVYTTDEASGTPHLQESMGKSESVYMGIGSVLGIRFRLLGLPSGQRVRLVTRITVSRESAGEERIRQEYVEVIHGNLGGVQDWTFRAVTADDLVSGIWVFEAMHGGRSILRHEFNVAVETGPVLRATGTGLDNSPEGQTEKREDSPDATD